MIIVHEHMGNLRREIKTQEKNQKKILECKTAVSECKFTEWA